MHNREAISAELTAINASFAHWPVHVPYTVPAGYFEALTELLMEHLVTGLPVKVNVYTVPENYFEQLPEKLLHAIRHEEVSAELENVAPFLNTLSKKTPYTTATEPFINVRAILHDTATEQPGKLVQMPGKKLSGWMRFAVAAVMIGIVITAAFVFNTNKGYGTADHINYAQVDISTEISKLSEDELATYLSSAEKLVIATADRESLLINELPDVNDHLEYMSDDELNEYLHESTDVASSATAGTNS